MSCYFEWDPAKEQINRKKHGVGFELASTVFHDPLALSIFDEEHSSAEERWITLGQSRAGVLLVVIHTFRQSNPDHEDIRIISARRATKREQAQYEK
jgi:uncharacterized DUF497 family protein